MVFIGNPRRGTNRGGGDRIILRSMQSKLHLQQASVQEQTSSFRSNYVQIPLKFRKQTIESPDPYADAPAFASASDPAFAPVALT